MRKPFSKPCANRAQTLVFFTLALGTICLLCGFAIDSGLLYLAKARLSRAVDGAALAAVGNFSQEPWKVAKIMRDFAVANYEDLGTSATGGISDTAAMVPGTYTTPNGLDGVTQTYNFNDGTQDANGQYKRYVEVILQLGVNGQVTSATCNARCPVKTYFMVVAGSFFTDLKVSSSAVATRNPRLIMVVVDRSGSMLSANGGAFGLPTAIVTFLNFFDTASDSIGMVSFSGNARLEFPLTTNFLTVATNNMVGSYDTNPPPNSTTGYPREDAEQSTDPNYFTTGVRRLKFGGSTCADEGIRMAYEQLQANSGYNNPDVLKYMVIFTDGAWNCARTLVAAPGYTNLVSYPTTINTTNIVVHALNAADTNNILTVPTFSPFQDMMAALTNTTFDPNNHLNDIWQSIDGEGYEPLTGVNPPIAYAQVVGAPTNLVTTSLYKQAGGTNYYADTINVWMPPGSVDYLYDGAGNRTTFVSNYRTPSANFTVTLPSGGSNVLVVPGYIIDGTITDSLDMTYPWPNGGLANYKGYRRDNYLENYTWADAASPANQMSSVMRQMMFRNYANMLTGYFIFRADDPIGAGLEPLITDYPAYSSGYPRALYGLSAYYPSPGFYWPCDLTGFDHWMTFVQPDASTTPDTPNYYCRKLQWSINMLSTNAAPNWAGELFYRGTNAALSDTSSQSSLITSKAEWKNGAPGWIDAFDNSTCMTLDTAHNTNNLNSVVVWRPKSFNGSNDIIPSANVTPNGSGTSGYVTDGTNYYRNTMAYSGRPTHYYDFSRSTWVSITHNHHTTEPSFFTALGNWKAKEYAWHMRAQGVTIYTVGYGGLVSPDQQVLLAQVANATNTTAGSNILNPNGTNIPFNDQQPIGQQFYATTPTEISNDFYIIGQSINTSLTQ